MLEYVGYPEASKAVETACGRLSLTMKRLPILAGSFPPNRWAKLFVVVWPGSRREQKAESRRQKADLKVPKLKT